MRNTFLEFEQPLAELESKIEQLRFVQTDSAVDISEEIVRFYSHLKQFAETMENETACGKKLDFITQEMFRETNTIGSKANSPDVLARVVEMKSGIERIREMVQNIE